MNNEHSLERLIKAIDYLKLMGLKTDHESLAARLGYSRTHLTHALNNDPRCFTQRFIQRFAKTFSEYIRPEWLLDGEGPMTREEMETTRPHIPVDVATVAAGTLGYVTAGVSPADTERQPLIRAFADYDFTIPVTGDSMMPLLAPGDVVACRRIDGVDEVNPKRIYVIDTTDGAIVKNIVTDPRQIAGSLERGGYDLNPDDCIVARSLNDRYPDKPVLKSSINGIFLVVGHIHSHV